MVQHQLASFILIANCEAWAVHDIFAAGPLCQPLHKSCFASPKVADQLNNLSALKLPADRFGDSQSIA